MFSHLLLLLLLDIAAVGTLGTWRVPCLSPADVLMIPTYPWSSLDTHIPFHITAHFLLLLFVERYSDYYQLWLLPPMQTHNLVFFVSFSFIMSEIFCTSLFHCHYVLSKDPCELWEPMFWSHSLRGPVPRITPDSGLIMGLPAVKAHYADIISGISPARYHQLPSMYKGYSVWALGGWASRERGWTVHETVALRN